VSSPSAASDRAAWIEEHRVCWRLGPFSEQLGGRGVVQTGYELVLLGRFHSAGPAKLEATAHALHERLRALALEVIGHAPPDVLLCVLPLGPGPVAAGERFAIEVELVVVASLAHPDKLPAPVATRQRIVELEGRLRAMGLPPCGEFATSRRST
jgi:hypothetical protein